MEEVLKNLSYISTILCFVCKKKLFFNSCNSQISQQIGKQATSKK